MYFEKIKAIPWTDYERIHSVWSVFHLKKKGIFKQSSERFKFFPCKVVEYVFVSGGWKATSVYCFPDSRLTCRSFFNDVQSFHYRSVPPKASLYMEPFITVRKVLKINQKLVEELCSYDKILTNFCVFQAFSITEIRSLAKEEVVLADQLSSSYCNTSPSSMITGQGLWI